MAILILAVIYRELKLKEILFMEWQFLEKKKAKEEEEEKEEKESDLWTGLN